jgi:hypothetical protein
MIAQKNLGLMKLKFVIRRHPPVFLRSRLVCLAWLVRLAPPLSFRHRTLADQRENPKSLAGADTTTPIHETVMDTKWGPI